MAESSINQPVSNEAMNNGMKLIGEAAVMPGASLLLDGKIGEGVLHAVLGTAARLLLGPPGWILIAANSYSRSVSGKGLYEHFIRSSGSSEPQRTRETDHYSQPTP